MSSVTCPQCHASFHVGPLYVQQEFCPRCGTSFIVPRRGLREQLASGVLRRRRPVGALDWEAITNSQYAPRQCVSKPEREPELDSERPSHRAA